MPVDWLAVSRHVGGTGHRDGRIASNERSCVARTSVSIPATVSRACRHAADSLMRNKGFIRD